MTHIPIREDSSCTEIQDNLEAYLDNELDADTYATVAAHVASLFNVSG